MNSYGFFKVAGATPEVKVGDCRWNRERIAKLAHKAANQGVELLALPELSLTGYTCQDLFLQPLLLEAASKELQELVEACSELPIAVVVGMPIAVGNSTYNCAVLFAEGEILGVVPKSYIPNYGEFYESRWFTSGADITGSSIELLGQVVPFGTDLIFKINGVECGIEICEDLWVPAPPSTELALSGAKLIVNLSASPEVVGKNDYLCQLVEQQSARLRAGYLYVSAGFGESSTDLTFAGNILIADQGERLAQSNRFSLDEQLISSEIDVEYITSERRRVNTFTGVVSRDMHIVECELQQPQFEMQRRFSPMPFIPSNPTLRQSRCEEIFNIQAFALAKRLKHTGCKSAVIGISGGLDSTLALLVAVRTFDMLSLDRNSIYGITMPGFGTTDRTYNNALELMSRLGITQKEISIVKAVNQHFEDIELDPSDRSATYENSQARERTQILMDYANKVGGLVIGTGDLSELALGWATYNGDHMSMYGVNGSVPKTLVRYLVMYVAEQMKGRVGEILVDIVETPVSPELLPADERGNIAQKTEDLVGPYELHDFFLYHFIRRGASPSKILHLALHSFEGEYDRDTILKWLKTFFRRFFSQQFKRSALPDGPKVGSVSLSPRGDWRMSSDSSMAVWMQELEEL